MPRIRNVPKRKRVIPQKRKSSTKRTSAQPTTAGSMLVPVARKILGVLPGSSITLPLADFVFSYFGLSLCTGGYTIGNDHNFGDVQFSGCGGAFHITPRSFLGNSQIGITMVSTTGNPEVVYQNTNYRTARLVSFRITATPTGPVQLRQGNWGMGFFPIKIAKDYDTIAETLKVTGPTMQLVRNCAMYRVGSCSQRLSFRKYFTPADGRAYQPIELSDSDVTSEKYITAASVGVVIVAYENTARDLSKKVTREEFQVSFNVTGKCVVSDRRQDGYDTHTTNIFDPLHLKKDDPIHAFIATPKMSPPGIAVVSNLEFEEAEGSNKTEGKLMRYWKYPSIEFKSDQGEPSGIRKAVSAMAIDSPAAEGYDECSDA